MTSIRELIDAAAPTINSDSPRLDAELLLAHVLGQPRSYLYTWPERKPESAQVQQYHALIARRQRGEPIAYLLNQREFWSLELSVNPSVLIPRPETELLIETLLSRALPAETELLDLGTGSGAIALALAKERPGWRITATDSSQEALATAQDNARRLGLNRISFLCGHWFEALAEQQFDIIVSNPPYIAAADPHLKTGDVRFEPLSALSAGIDGLNDLREIIKKAPAHLKSRGLLIVEHGYDQGAEVAALFAGSGFDSIASLKDLGGRSRATIGEKY
ncbi:MAG: peptide chain release factor N(5)-glutamine methyltransferase [Thiotrichales bacterium]